MGMYGKRYPSHFLAYSALIAARQAFDAGHLYGYPVHPVTRDPKYGWHGYGNLPERFQVYLTGADYMIFSYATPVAWHVPALYEGGSAVWIMPAVTYSVSTGKHLGKIRPAIGMLPEILDGSVAVFDGADLMDPQS